VKLKKKIRDGESNPGRLTAVGRQETELPIQIDKKIGWLGTATMPDEDGSQEPNRTGGGVLTKSATHRKGREDAPRIRGEGESNGERIVADSYYKERGNLLLLVGEIDGRSRDRAPCERGKSGQSRIEIARGGRDEGFNNLTRLKPRRRRPRPGRARGECREAGGKNVKAPDTAMTAIEGRRTRLPCLKETGEAELDWSHTGRPVGREKGERYPITIAIGKEDNNQLSIR